MNLKILYAGAKKRLVKELDGQFGILKVSYLLFETGRQKIRGFSGSMTREEIQELAEIANLEFIGIYLFRREGQLRLSLDGSEIFKNQIGKNKFILNREQLDLWFHGKNIDVVLKKGVYVVCYGNDFLGCGISDGKKLINYMPKERRIRNG
jgi:NOL1/NOP2/fmu family ribosome biogenesis protein